MVAVVDRVQELLADEAEDLLGYQARGIERTALYLPGGDFVDRVVSQSDRSAAVLGNYRRILDHGRLGGTGYVSVLPVDQGIEHSAGYSFAPNPMYFDPEHIVRLAIEGGCNAVASSVAVLGAVARKFAGRVPFIAKLNHNELLTYPNHYDQVMFAQVEQAFELGATAVGATVYWGSPEGRRQMQEVSAAFARAHELGMVTVLWCYLRNDGFKTQEGDYHRAADLSGQADHLGASIGADIVKQKLPETNRGYEAVGFGRTREEVYEDLMPGDHPIERARYQVVNAFMGRVPTINSGGASGKDDFAEAARTAVINKRAGGMGLISGRKAFQRPFHEGVELLHLIQDVYLDESINVA